MSLDKMNGSNQKAVKVNTTTKFGLKWKATALSGKDIPFQVVKN
jgi:hypothetical protein